MHSSPYSQAATYLLDFANSAVTNNYTAFFMNAVAMTGQLGVDAEEDQKRSISRCTANGIATENCLKIN